MHEDLLKNFREQVSACRSLGSEVWSTLLERALGELESGGPVRDVFTGDESRPILNNTALRLMGADPIRIKQLAFGLSIATAAVAGALLIIIGPVEPSINRQYIGRVFAIVVLGGMGSIAGTWVAALILGVAESIVATFYGPSWAPAVAFGILLITLALRPQGLFGRH